LQTKFVENIKTHFMFYNLFLENRAVNEIIWKIVKSRAGPKWQHGARASKNTPRTRNAYWLCTATTVAWTRL